MTHSRPLYRQLSFCVGWNDKGFAVGQAAERSPRGRLAKKKTRKKKKQPQLTVAAVLFREGKRVRMREEEREEGEE